MKNLFKNLMLVAVAAMAFTACEKDNADTNKGEEKTVITFDVDIEGTGTRTYFGAYDEETGYPTLLSGNETAKFNHWTTGNGNLENQEATINNGRFTVGFNYVNSGETIDAYLPASAWGDVKHGEWGEDGFSDVYREYTIPSEQNPSQTSVDEKAHIFKATTSYNGENNIDLIFKHQVAYGKLSLNNFAGTGVKQYVLTVNGKMYVVNATWTEDVWFACEPGEVTDMSISVVANEGTYTKTIIEGGNKPLAFVKGQVSKFGVNMDGVTTGEAVDTFDPTYVMDNIAFDTSLYTREGFKMTGASLPYPNNDYVSFYLNPADYTSTSINTGTYKGNSTGSDNYNPESGYFAGRLSLNWGTITKPRAFTSDSTLDVSFADGVYTIVLTHNGVSYGYRGLPNGWSAPAGGGNEGGETPEVVKLATPEVTATVDGKNVTVNWNTVDGAANYTVSVDGTVKESAYTSTTYTFEGTYSTTHTISVVANPANTTTHSVSEAGTATAEIGADPNAGGSDEPTIDLTGRTQLTTIDSWTKANPYYDMMVEITMSDEYNSSPITFQLCGTGVSYANKTLPEGTYNYATEPDTALSILNCKLMTTYTPTSATATVYNDNGVYTILIDFNGVSTLFGSKDYKFYYQGSL